MVYLRWLLSMPLSYLMLLVGLILAPVLPFFVDKETHRLPKWLDWFATDDNDADGDEGHWQRWPGTDAWATYKRRVAWMWRNTSYGFDINVLGVEVCSSDSWEVTGDENASDTNGVSGTCRRRCRRDGKLIAFQLCTTSSTTGCSAGRAVCGSTWVGSCGDPETRRHSTSVFT